MKSGENPLFSTKKRFPTVPLRRHRRAAGRKMLPFRHIEFNRPWRLSAESRILPFPRFTAPCRDAATGIYRVS